MKSLTFPVWQSRSRYAVASAPVRLEVSTADKTSNSPLKGIEGQVMMQSVHVSAFTTSLI